MAFAEPFDVYLADFGQDVTLNGAAVRVIFDNAYRELFDGVATRTPTAGLPTGAAGSASQGALLVTGGRTYRVTSVQPDGTGWTTLALELQ